MEVKEELLDVANEKIINKLDNVLGCHENKNVLRNIIRYNKILKSTSCDIEFENYNIIIKNESNYDSFLELIEIISDIYVKNKIIKEKGFHYLTREELEPRNKGKNKNEIKEGIIIIIAEEFWRFDFHYKKNIIELINKYPTKVFIIIVEDRFQEAIINQAFNDFFTWNMKINRVSDEEKIKYTINFLKKNKINCSKNIAKEISDVPFYQLKNELINLMVKCKSKNVNNVKQVLENHKVQEKNKEKKISGREELDKLIGIEEVKKQVYKVVNYIKNSKNRNKMPMLHMCFTGNPGTGKTTVARIVGEIFKEEEILSTGSFVEAQRADLIGEFIGHTAPKTMKKIEEAKGGVLFIDEAYNLSYSDSQKDYGHECVATLIKEMEDKRDDLCVILAGYSKEMEQLLNTNPGFRSRIQFNIEFPDYSEEELFEIFKIMCNEEGFKISPSVKKMLINHFEIAKKEENFSNGRYVRNIFEKIKMEQANRVIEEKSDPNLIKKVDVETIINSEISKKQTNNKIKIGFIK